MAIIRSYIANSKKEAFDKVKFDLGNEAVIINTRKIRKKGFLNVFKKPVIEMTAVSDDMCDFLVKKNKPENYEQSPTQHKESGSDNKLEYLEKQMSLVSDMVGKVHQNIDYIKQKKLTEDDLKVQELYTLLRNSDLSEASADELIGEVLESAEPEDCNLREKLNKVIVNHLGNASPICIKENQKRIIFFVGPTGVGKTTTLAKIAASFSLQHNAKVGIITEDTYRIGAVEQLRIYADILGVPLYVVYSPEDIRQKIESMGELDLVFVDTAGKNINDTEYHKTIKKMIKSFDDVEVHLVISATTGTSNAVRILNSYSFLNDFKLLFTKLDETEKCGLIVELKLITDKPLSYVTNGQNVASDIYEANAVDISNNILGCENT